MSKVDLKLDWCSYEAAKYAVEHWHYSKTMSTPPNVYIGVWENSVFIGCVIFGRGANNNLGSPYGLQNIEVCELTRVALNNHVTPVSRINAISMKMMKNQNKGLRLCVSFADTNQGHHGGIYQAGGWVYSGQTPPSYKYVDKNGREWHQRQVSKTGVKPQYGELRAVAKIDECKKILQTGKYRYLFPLDDAMRKQIEHLRKPYPKRGRDEAGNVSQSNEKTGGSNPTRPLLYSEKNSE